MYLCEAFECVRCGEDGRGSSDFDEVEGVYDADASAFVKAEDCLSVLEVGIHLCGGVGEPRAQVFAGVVSVLFFTCELIRCGESGDEQA